MRESEILLKSNSFRRVVDPRVMPTRVVHYRRCLVLYYLKKVIPHLGSRRESGKLGLNPNSRPCMRLPLPGSRRKQS